MALECCVPKTKQATNLGTEEAHGEKEEEAWTAVADPGRGPPRGRGGVHSEHSLCSLKEFWQLARLKEWMLQTCKQDRQSYLNHGRTMNGSSRRASEVDAVRRKRNCIKRKSGPVGSATMRGQTCPWGIAQHAQLDEDIWKVEDGKMERKGLACEIWCSRWNLKAASRPMGNVGEMFTSV